MTALHSVRALPPERRRLVLAALATTLAARIALRLLPFRWVRTVAARAGRPKTQGASLADLVWAVSAASRYVPSATCLTQAVALQLLLARHGHEAELRLGVERLEEGTIAAHAWVESGDRIVLGGVDSARFTPLAHIASDGNGRRRGALVLQASLLPTTEGSARAPLGLDPIDAGSTS